MSTKSSQQRDPLAYRERTYRLQEQSGLVSSFVRMVETDLHILGPMEFEDEATPLVARVRNDIESYIRHLPEFATSLVPLPEDDTAPEAVKQMLAAGRTAGVGPMAAVAGTVAEFVGRELLVAGHADLIVENGGDIFIAREEDCSVSIFAGSSSLSNRVGIRLPRSAMPCGVCCSSGSVGHSLSLGKADAVVVTAASTPLADAAATRIGNEVKEADSGIEAALKAARNIEGINGVVVIKGEQLGAWGDVELVRL